MATDNKRTGPQPQTGRGTRKAAESLGFLAIAAAVLVAANVVGYFWFDRIDLTSNRIFSLADGSESLVENLEDELKVTVYYTADLPSQWAAHERYVRDLLEEYAAAGSKVNLRWVNPDDEEEKTAARDAGVAEQVLGGSDTTSMTVVRGFVGIVLEYVGEREVINFGGPTTQGLEYEISSRIQKLAHEPFPVGVVSGHGSPSLTQGLTALRGALPNYELREVDLSQEIDQELRALLIIDPSEAFSATELQRINQYVMRGGSLGVFGGGLGLNLEGGQMGMPPSATPATTELNDLLAGWGIEIKSGMVADTQSIRVPMRGQMGLPVFVPFPIVPKIIFDDDAQEHPATFRVPYAPFFFSSPIEVTDKFHELDGVVLGHTSDEGSWLLTDASVPLQPRHPNEWRSTIGGERGPFNVLVAVQGELPSAFAGASAAGEGPTIEAPATSEGPVQVLVAGTGSMMRDQFLPRGQDGAQQLTEGLIIALNAIDWLAQDADLIAVRAKSIDEPLIEVPETLAITEAAQDEAQAAAEGDAAGAEDAREALKAAQDAWDAKRLWYQVLLGLGLPLVVAAFGLLRWWLRKNKRANLQALRKKLTAAKASA